MVREAWKLVRIPAVKNRFNSRAPLAIMPGTRPYMEIMYTIRITNAMTQLQMPRRIDSAPSVGPTISSLTILAGAGILPDFSTFARSRVSSAVKLPVIWLLPPMISDRTVGALYTLLSSTMATERRRLALVRAAQRRAPSTFICMLTQGRPFWSYSSLASVMTSPSRGARPLRSVTRMA